MYDHSIFFDEFLSAHDFSSVRTVSANVSSQKGTESSGIHIHNLQKEHAMLVFNVSGNQDYPRLGAEESGGNSLVTVASLLLEGFMECLPPAKVSLL